MKKLIVFGTLFSLLLAHPVFAQNDRSDELHEIMAALDSPSSAQRVNSAKIISRSGFKDKELYRKVAELLRSGYMREFEQNHTDEMSWMCKALAASGDSKYRDLLNEVAANSTSPKLQRYAKQSLDRFEQYARRNEILNEKDTWDENLSDEDNRLINMLKSDDVGLRRDAAKMIVRKFGTADEVFSITASTLTEMSKNAQTNSLNVDTMAWLCKALAASGDLKYRAVLDQLIESSDSGTNPKLIMYAKKARSSLN